MNYYIINPKFKIEARQRVIEKNKMRREIKFREEGYAGSTCLYKD